MTASDPKASERLSYAPEVAALLEGTGEQAELARSFVRFANALLDPDPSKIDDAITPDARFHELEEMGLPAGPAGFKIFRKQINGAFPDQQVRIAAMRFEGGGILETDLESTATHLGDLMGVPATGKQVRFNIHTRNRFVNGRMAERWDRADVQDILRQVKG